MAGYITEFFGYRAEDHSKASLSAASSGVCPQPIYDRVLIRLGGKERLPVFPTQPASIHFISYDYKNDKDNTDGKIRPLDLKEEHVTTVYKIQEAFSSMNLPDGNVYRDALVRSLYE